MKSQIKRALLEGLTPTSREQVGHLTLRGNLYQAQNLLCYVLPLQGLKHEVLPINDVVAEYITKRMLLDVVIDFTLKVPFVLIAVDAFILIEVSNRVELRAQPHLRKHLMVLALLEAFIHEYRLTVLVIPGEDWVLLNQKPFWNGGGMRVKQV